MGVFVVVTPHWLSGLPHPPGLVEVGVGVMVYTGKADVHKLGSYR